MSEAVISVHMSDQLLRDASMEADRRDMSLEDWLISLAQEQVRQGQAVERFFHRATQRTDSENRQALLSVLDRVPDLPPVPGDELEN